MDKRRGQIEYEIEIDRSSNLPTAIRMLVLTGVRDTGDATNDGQHVVFQFDWTITDVNALEPFSMPRSILKLLR